MATLSALIELGRFYFPNIDKHDCFGNEKPCAYRGYRNIVLEFLVYYFEICQMSSRRQYLGHLEKLRRLFTDKVFEALQPAKYGRFVKKYTGMAMNPNMSLQEFLESAPQEDRGLSG